MQFAHTILEGTVGVGIPPPYADWVGNVEHLPRGGSVERAVWVQ